MVNGWTSNDVPSVSSLGLYNRRPDLDLDGKRFGAAVALEAVVAHLNAHYPKSESQEQLLRMCDAADLKRARAEEDAARWRSAYEIVEGERDLARERLREHLFGVEAEPADPVEELARELYRAATPDARWETVADEYRRIARYVTDWETP